MSDMVLTANRLSDGIAVWYTKHGTWSTSRQDADVSRNPDRIAQLEAIGKQAYADNQVLDVAMIDVSVIGGTITPLRMREKIRADGPSIDYAPGFGPSVKQTFAA
jgi:Protein of unknown function (DUF2849)